MTMQMNEFFYGGNGKPHWQGMDDYQRSGGYGFDRRTSGRTVPTYEFRVPMCCSKCEEKVREELSELEGVYEVYADQVSELVVVTGFVDPFHALKKMKRIKKKSEFWDGSTPSSRSYDGHHKKTSYRSSSHKHQYPRHETVYHSSPSQVSYNREHGPRASSSLRRSYGPVSHGLPNRKFNHGSYDDGMSHGLSYRNKYGSYDDGMSHGHSYRNKYGSYDDGMSHGLSYRNKYGSYDDGVPYSSNKHGSYDDGVSYSSNKYRSYDDGVAYSSNKFRAYDDGVPYRNKYGSYDDGVSYSDLRPSSSPFTCLPRSGRSLWYDTVPPFAQDYYTEDYVEDYPLFNRY